MTVLKLKYELPFLTKIGKDGEVQTFERRPYQQRIKDITARFLVLIWHRRSGKTLTASHKLVSEAIQKREGRYAYLAPTYKQAKRIVWKILKKTLPDWIEYKINEVELTIHIIKIKDTNYIINSQIELLGADDPDSLRGIGLDGAILDEYDKMPGSLWGEIIRPTLAETGGWAWFLGTPKGKTKLYTLLQQVKTGLYDWYGEVLTVDETGAISNEEMQSIKDDPSISEDEINQEYYCSFLYHSGLIFKEFNPNIHVIEPFEIPKEWLKFRAMDYGETNPNSWGWYTVDNDDNVYKYREYYKAGEMVSTHAAKVKEFTGAEKIEYSVIDPSVNNRRGASGHKIQKEYQIAGIKTVLGRNDVKAGINRVREYLKVDPERIHPVTKRKGSPRLFIFDTCEKTIWEFDRYRYKENKEGLEQNKSEDPLKLDDHAMDETRYALMSRPEIRGTVKQRFKPEDKTDPHGLYLANAQKQFKDILLKV